MLRRLDEGEVDAEAEDLESKKKMAVRLGRAAIAPTIRSLLQSVGGAAQLPKLIASAASGDFGPLATTTLTIRRSFLEAVSPGMFLAVAGAEDLPLTNAEELARVSRDTFLGDYYFQQVRRVSTLMPLGKMPRDYREPLKSDAPTLLISGFLDPATPPAGGDEVARHLPNSLHVVVRNASHSYGGLSPCMDKIMAEFISRGAVEELDIACTKEVRRPPFVLPEKPKP
ncbi:hypothetical protein BH20VER1_BH20VER1_17940 [soil metagenome]